jgi:DAACS family dicarboxylate/amino acid:cation (Na+ or H+) symporter/aerobic C4-dicarboxylate transport protein
MCGLSQRKYLRYIRDEILIALGTASTEAVLPTGYTFNADGRAIYLTMAALFIAQAMNIHLSIWDQLLVLGVLLLTSKGSEGVVGAGFVALAATLAPMHKIPVEGLVRLLGVDRFLNEARAVTNLIGNGVATVVVAHWEGRLDLNKARAVLNRETPTNSKICSRSAIQRLSQRLGAKRQSGRALVESIEDASEMKAPEAAVMSDA